MYVCICCVQVRVENIKDPADHIPAVLERVRHDYLIKTYQVWRYVHVRREVYTLHGMCWSLGCCRNTTVNRNPTRDNVQRVCKGKCHMLLVVICVKVSIAKYSFMKLLVASQAVFPFLPTCDESDYLLQFGACPDPKISTNDETCTMDIKYRNSLFFQC